MLDHIYKKAENGDFLTLDEGIELYENAPLNELREVANSIRNRVKKDANIVTWQIDRNVNITNVCVSGCKFCNFHCKPHQREKHFITSLDEYKVKIEQTIALGGDQLLLQGGMHPKLNIDWYEGLFRELKSAFPNIRLHALGPPEISHIAKISGVSVQETLERLIDAGLSSLPGAGAEILVSEVRKRVSPAKCSAEEWLSVMEIAHKLNLATSATMMYGHIETKKNRVEHLIKIRDLQSVKPEGAYGFLAFIPWVYCGNGTELEREGVKADNSTQEYLRIIALSRIMLPNIENIQASWLTMGKEAGKLALSGGANDLGSIMIEENVVASVGVRNKMGREEMEQVIRDAGYVPKLRDQLYQFRE